MNAHALLSSQGWRGHGHSLHKTNDSIGLAKPLLLNRKDNTRGLGATQHFTSDQWWMNAFDEQLQGLETSKDGQVKQTLTTGKLNAIEKPSLGKYYLYSSFVKGGFLQGTLSSLENSSSSSDSDSDDDEPTQTLADIAKNSSRDEETKEERRARKEEKRKRREAKALKKAAKKLKKSKSSDSEKLAKEEKKARRAKKEEKRRQRKDKDEKKKSKK